VEPRDIPVLFKWALGSVETSGGGPYTHEFKPVDQLKSFTAIIGAEGTYRRLSGCLIDRLQLESALDYLTGSAEILAAREERDTEFTPSPDISMLPPFAFHQASLTLGGSEASAKLRAFRLRIDNNIPVDHLYGFGERYPRRIVVGGRTIEAQLELAFTDTAEYEAFLAGEELSLNLQFSDGSNSLAIHLPRCLYRSDVAPHLDRREPFTLTAPLQVLHDPNAGYEVKITVVNEEASY